MLRTTGKNVKMGLAGARGRESWDPVVAEPPLLEVHSSDRPYSGQAFRGATSEERCEKKHAVRKQGLQTVHVVRTLRKTELLLRDGEGENSRVPGSN